jgi:hypothetical protein
MPKFSIFTPLGHLKFSSAKPLGQQLFETGKAGFGTSFKIERGSRVFAWLYAWSMSLATLKVRLDRAGKQWDPRFVYEYIDEYEGDRGIVPRPGQSFAERREELVWRRKLLPKPTRANVENMFHERIGAAFLAFLPTSKADVVNWPESLGESPMLLARANLPRALAKTKAPIASPGSQQWVFYERHSSGVEWELRDRDVVVIEPEVPDRAERVTVLAITAGDEAGYSIRVLPTKAHPAGATIARAPLPIWTGTKRRSLVVLSAEGAEDPEIRRRAHEVLERMLRATSTWDLAGANEDGESAGPFTVGGGKLGVTPIGYFEL